MAFGLWILIHRLGNYNGYNHPICFPSSATIFYFLSLWGVHLSNTNKRIQGTRNSSPCPLPRAGQCLGSHLMGDSKPLLIVSPPTLYSPWMGFRGSDTLDKKVVWMYPEFSFIVILDSRVALLPVVKILVTNFSMFYQPIFPSWSLLSSE